jgi:hypothetical protein
MAKIVPRHVIVGGVRLVVLTEREYEGLAASRRQFGSHVVRLRMARGALASLTRAAEAMCAFLRSDEALAAAFRSAPHAARLASKDLVGALEAAVEQARGVLGPRAEAPAGAARGPRRERCQDAPNGAQP